MRKKIGRLSVIALVVALLVSAQFVQAEAGLSLTKTASSSEIISGETVVYTYMLENIGDVDLVNVSVVDDSCSPVSYTSGDDGDSILNQGEIWTFNCSVELTQTTTNTATATADDLGGVQVSDTAQATVAVIEAGCVMSQGYWKTHSDMGPAPYDLLWDARIGEMYDDMTWSQILWTPPKKGNAWIILAHQYIAAQMNMDNGSAVPAEINDAFIAAGDLLSSFDWDQKMTKEERKEFLEHAEALDGYNTGMTIVSHCADVDHEEPDSEL